jgi:hypothetical protein
MVQDKSYDFEVKGQVIKGRDWHIAVGAVMKSDITQNELDNWFTRGKTDKSHIEKYVGVLYVGNNDVYDINIDLDNKQVVSLIGPASRYESRIPELTKDDRENAVLITLNDAHVREVLSDKNYSVAPDRVVIWHSTKDHQKIGARLEIQLDKTYSIDYVWFFPEYDETKFPSFPYYKVKNNALSCDTQTIVIFVDLAMGEVVGITPSPNPAMIRK